jgi:para-aminobenzoate synthetase/4-amino-4-deoxychorismate lyase
MRQLQDDELLGILAFLAHEDDFVFLDTSKPGQDNNVSLLFTKPHERLICRYGDEPQEYLAKLAEELRKGSYLAGWLSYEFGALLEAGIAPRATVRENNDLVLADFGVFSEPFRFNHETGMGDFPCRPTPPQPDANSYDITELCANMTKNEFVAALQRVREYIAAGDTYQVNYTMKLLFQFSGSAEQLYRELRRNQSVAYGAFLSSRGEKILSFSPELFFRLCDREVTVRPMKGTVTVGKNLEERTKNSNYLHFDDKNRSENVMIVDLLRNDLARLMYEQGGGRVYVDSLFDVEPFESLVQMTSTIKAHGAHPVLESPGLVRLVRALFPCGSITGAPKIRTMEIIKELEKEDRGVYTGAIGYFSPEGKAVFNVPIRTIRLRDGRGEMGIGAGITYGSVPEDEWDESLLKGRFLTHRQPRFHLLETLLWQREGGYLLLAEHLERMADAAAFFQYVFAEQLIRDALLVKAAEFSESQYRVRLLLAKDGTLEIQPAVWSDVPTTVLPENPEPVTGEALPRISFSWQRTNSRESWLYYKTTRRELYDRLHLEARQLGLFDYLFCNEAGEVTEGCISNLIIHDGNRYLTPPVRSGLLGGVMRRKLLNDATVRVHEKVLYPEDVAQAKALYLCNSVRGVVRVRF